MSAAFTFSRIRGHSSPSPSSELTPNLTAIVGDPHDLGLDVHPVPPPLDLQHQRLGVGDSGAYFSVQFNITALRLVTASPLARSSRCGRARSAYRYTRANTWQDLRPCPTPSRSPTPIEMRSTALAAMRRDWRCASSPHGPAMGATSLLDVASAHVDGCLYHGRPGSTSRAGSSTAEHGRGADFLNVSSLDLLHPELVRLGRTVADDARALMESYVRMGPSDLDLCAVPVAGAPRRSASTSHGLESNAIVFANSVLGLEPADTATSSTSAARSRGGRRLPVCISTRNGSRAPCSASVFPTP